MSTTLLSTLLSRMNRYQVLANIETQFKVRDLDDAIRTLKRTYNLPFYQKQATLKLFPDILEYPVVADHDYLIYLDNESTDFSTKLRARYTSMRQFYEDPDYRNQIAEIWHNNVLSIGVRDRIINGQSQTLQSADSLTGTMALADASALALSNTVVKDSQTSIQFLNTPVLEVAGVIVPFPTKVSDPDFKKKWFFSYVYLTGIPTRILIQLSDDTNGFYLAKNVFSQFGGRPFEANAWNLVAMELESADVNGTPTASPLWDHDTLSFYDAPPGLYYLGPSYLKTYETLDYWYYSKYAVAAPGSTFASQEGFFNDAGVYDEASSLIGDSEWTDLVLYEAMLSSLTDEENAFVYNSIKAKRDAALAAISTKWPDAKPLVTTNRYSFSTGLDSESQWLF